MAGTYCIGTVAKGVAGHGRNDFTFLARRELLQFAITSVETAQSVFELLLETVA